MKTISIIGTVGVPARYGGFESLVDNLLDFTPPDVSYTIYCCLKAYVDKPDKYKNANLKYINLSANGISSIAYDVFSLYKARKSSIILILGVSGCLFLPLFRLFYKGRIITNIDGLEWKRAKWNSIAKFILHLSEKTAVKYSDIIIGDNKGITDYIWNAYKMNAELIAYGANHALPVNKGKYIIDYPFVRSNYAVTVCRIEPENNIGLILDAFSRNNVSQPLVIVGNWQKSEYGKKMYCDFSDNKNVLLLDPIYDIDRINYIRSNASLYIHGHSAGGTNPSLVEAMNLSLVVLAFDCVYNRETTENKAIYWKNADELFEIIKQDHHKSVGLKMKEIANRNYNWQIISDKYNALYL